MSKKTSSPGAPPHEPTRATRELVQLHTMVGTTQETLADIIGIDPKTLRKYYREELDQSKARANATIGGALFNKAKSGDTAAMIFWMKTQAGWKETQILDHTTKGESIKAPSAIDASSLSTSTLEELLKAKKDADKR